MYNDRPLPTRREIGKVRVGQITLGDVRKTSFVDVNAQVDCISVVKATKSAMVSSEDGMNGIIVLVDLLRSEPIPQQGLLEDAMTSGIRPVPIKYSEKK